MRQIHTEEELKKRLAEFYKVKFPKQRMKGVSGLLAKNFIILAISFIVAAGLFTAFNLKFAVVQRNFVVPIEFRNIPSNILVNDVVPQEVVVTLQGRSSDVDLLNPQTFKATVDISSVRNVLIAGWHIVPIGQKNLELPFGISPVKIDPSSVRVLTEQKPATSR